MKINGRNPITYWKWKWKYDNRNVQKLRNWLINVSIGDSSSKDWNRTQSQKLYIPIHPNSCSSHDNGLNIVSVCSSCQLSEFLPHISLKESTINQIKMVAIYNQNSNILHLNSLSQYIHMWIIVKLFSIKPEWNLIHTALVSQIFPDVFSCYNFVQL